MMKTRIPFLFLGIVAALASWGGYVSLSQRAAPPLPATAVVTARQPSDNSQSAATQTDSAPAETGARLARELEALRLEMRHLQAQVETLRQQPAKANSPRAATRSPARKRHVDDSQTGDFTPQAEQAEPEDVEAAFQQEPLDAVWSTQASDAIWQAQVQEELADLPVQAVECHATRCRVEIALDDPGTVHQLLPLLALHLAPVLPTMTVQPVGEGDDRMVIFLQ